MLFSPKERIAGFPVKRIRGLLRKLETTAWHSDALIAYHLKDTLQAGIHVAQDLLTRKWLVASNDGYTLTPLGRQAAAARIGVPLTREKASELISEVQRRAKEWNNLEGVQLIVTEVSVFGSYLTEAEKQAKIDLAVKFERTANFSIERHDQEPFAKANGLSMPKDRVSNLVFWELSLFKFLKNRQAAVSLTLSGESYFF